MPITTTTSLFPLFLVPPSLQSHQSIGTHHHLNHFISPFLQCHPTTALLKSPLLLQNIKLVFPEVSNSLQRRSKREDKDAELVTEVRISSTFSHIPTPLRFFSHISLTPYYQWQIQSRHTPSALLFVVVISYHSPCPLHRFTASTPLNSLPFSCIGFRSSFMPLE